MITVGLVAGFDGQVYLANNVGVVPSKMTWGIGLHV